jgi:hypothetical protein
MYNIPEADSGFDKRNKTFASQQKKKKEETREKKKKRDALKEFDKFITKDFFSFSKAKITLGLLK